MDVDHEPLEPSVLVGNSMLRGLGTSQFVQAVQAVREDRAASRSQVAADAAQPASSTEPTSVLACSAPPASSRPVLPPSVPATALPALQQQSPGGAFLAALQQIGGALMHDADPGPRRDLDPPPALPEPTVEDSTVVRPVDRAPRTSKGPAVVVRPIAVRPDVSL